jgi:hypothetical protein
MSGAGLGASGERAETTDPVDRGKAEPMMIHTILTILYKVVVNVRERLQAS